MTFTQSRVSVVQPAGPTPKKNDSNKTQNLKLNQPPPNIKVVKPVVKPIPKRKNPNDRDFYKSAINSPYLEPFYKQEIKKINQKIDKIIRNQERIIAYN